MKKSKIKWEVRQAMSGYYENGFTNTADKVFKEICDRLDKIYSK